MQGWFSLPVKAIKTDREFAALKPQEGRYEVKVSGIRGLVARVYPSGAKVFEVRYVTLNGMRRRMVLGEYPGLSLVDAVEQAEGIRVDARRGSDPAGELRAKRHQARTGDTVADLAEAYFQAAEKGVHGGRNHPKRPSSIKVERYRFANQIAPNLGDHRFADIKRSDVKQFMRGLITRGDLSPDYIASIGRTLSSIFAFAVHEERLDVNPVAGLTKPLATMHRERMFDDEALKKLWLALTKPLPDGMKRHPQKQSEGHEDKWPPVDPAVSSALQFALLTLTRRQDVVGASWSEFDFKAKTWTVPSARHKSRRTHVVPLTESAIKVLRKAAELAGVDLDGPIHPDGFVWPSRTTEGNHISAGALTRAMTRLCQSLKIPHGTPHDFRRSGATLLTGERGGVRRFIVSKVLGHSAQEGAVVTEVYDRNDYLPEKRHALERWEALLLEIVGERRRPANVATMRKALPRG